MREVFGGVRAVTLLCADVDAARGFYADRLGLAVMREQPGSFAVVNAGTFRLRLETAGPGSSPTCGVVLVFRVKDLALTARELDRRQVAYACRTHRLTGDYVQVTDPAGNQVRFSERV